MHTKCHSHCAAPWTKLFQMQEGDTPKMKTFKIIEAQAYNCEMLDRHKDIVKDLFLFMLPANGLRNQHGRFK